MKRTRFHTAIAMIGTMAMILAAAAWAGTDEVTLPVRFQERDLSGPRLGVSMVPGNGALWRDLDRNGIGRVISQFGWQFERQIVPVGGGPQFVIEAVPMVAGVEYGMVVPSATLAMGIRFPSGNEFGIGPNVIVIDGEEKVRSSLVIAVGHSFDYSGVSLPVNLVLATSPKGQRVSMVLGYAIQRTTRPAQF